MLLFWKKILAFFRRQTLTDREWYQHLTSYFYPPKAQLRWTEKNNRLEMNWDVVESHASEKLEIDDIRCLAPVREVVNPA